jgi:hypothetical protein
MAKKSETNPLPAVKIFAELEGLGAHGKSAEIRK